jgi:signal transduction histidine kinase
MPMDTQSLRSEAFVEVGRIIERDSGLLIERWADRAAAEQPHAARLHHETLLDDLPRFLRTLGRGLAVVQDPEDCPHKVPAAAHGEQRWQSGWSLPEVVQDYQILRRTLLEHLEEILNRPLMYREVAAVGLALDEAIASSVAAFDRRVDDERRHHERQAREAVQRQAEALRAADRRKNDFLAILAHELRNPLAPILHAAEVLRLQGPAEPPLDEARTIIERQVLQLGRLVDDLLDVARIAQGKLELRRGRFDLAEAVNQAAQTTAPLFEAQQHTLSVELPQEPLPVEADQARVVQVLVNLLTNAAKYTDRCGQVRLRAAREGGEVVLHVRDNGIGIEPGMIGRIFDLFTQVDRAMDRAQGGLGIGLTLVRHLVELHGGRVAARSEGAGKGSEFVVWLPATDGLPDAAPAAAPAPAKGRHVLIIEDNADARATLATLLTLLGHRVETAAAGAEGVERALAVRPEVALVDLGLPGLDGCEVARQLRAALGSAVRLIALTGHAQEEDRRRTQEAGFDAHLVKPVATEELTRVLNGG